MAANAFFKFARFVRDIPAEDFVEVKEAAQRQLDYNNDIRAVYTAEQHALGRFNMEVIRRVEELRALMLAGPERVAGQKAPPVM